MNARHGWLVGLQLALASAGSAVGDEVPVAPPQAARATLPAVRDAEPAIGKPLAPAAKSVRTPRAAPGASPPKSADRLELDTTLITGNRELPKVMVIVPWKRADIGELVGRPVNSLVDEALQPVDREVFRREIDYYGTLAPDQPRTETHVTGGSAADRPEK